MNVKSESEDFILAAMFVHSNIHLSIFTEHLQGAKLGTQDIPEQTKHSLYGACSLMLLLSGFQWS